MQTLELNDIQGIIIRGYGSLDETYFVMLAISDVSRARQWLATMADEIRNGESRPYDSVCNLAFTPQGLKTLGLGEYTLSQFSREFQEGMVTPHRSRVLGDHGDSAPEKWEWGSPNNDEIHILLMLYAKDRAALEDFYAIHADRFNTSGLEEIHRLHALTLKGRKEHFGFRDGIAQPLIEGLNKSGAPTNEVKAGEFLLGYRNEYDQLSESPTIEPSLDSRGLLANKATQPGLKDFGRNGSYLVFRQMRQHVRQFWQFMDEKARAMDGSENPHIKLASKMVGRWPSGAPLVNSPDKDNPDLQDDDRFLYHHTDPHGLRSPLGSHVRRTNPRDMLDPDPGSLKSIAIGNRHRIVRRGRAYGRPVAESMDPNDILNSPDDSEDRGLQFLCFNTNIGRQFEFIQQTWANNKRFAGLYDDADPIIGDHDPEDKGDRGVFTQQASPLRKRVTGLSSFVEVRGGAYFFMPGIRAVRYLASLP